MDKARRVKENKSETSGRMPGRKNQAVWNLLESAGIKIQFSL